MRTLGKILAVLIFGPFILGLLLVLAVVALVGAPLLWERLVARMAAPPGSETPSSGQ